MRQSQAGSGVLIIHRGFAEKLIFMRRTGGHDRNQCAGDIGRFRNTEAEFISVQVITGRYCPVHTDLFAAVQADIK